MQKGASCTGTGEIKEGGKRWREREKGVRMNRGERVKSDVIKENIIFKKGNLLFFFFLSKKYSEESID